MKIVKLSIGWLWHKRQQLRVWWCTQRAKFMLRSFGIGLRVNYPCLFNGNVTVGNYCNFNGMQVLGG